jgi:hypothetical protein
MSALASTFEIMARNGVWRATLDGRFFGDYRSNRLAIEGVEEAALALRSDGRTVRIVRAGAKAGH